MPASDFANWWDKKASSYDKQLEEWVSDHGGMMRVLLATTASTGIEVLGSFADVARLGEGFGEAANAESAWGVVKGGGKDVLRAVAVIGPLGKGLGLGVRIVATRVAVTAPLYADVGGNLCASISASQAIRRSGQKLLFNLDDILRNVYGKPLLELADDVSGLSMPGLMTVFEQLGVRARKLPQAQTLEQIASLLKGSDVAIIGVKWTNASGKEIRHALHVFKDVGGRLRLSDRTGPIVSSFKELADVLKKKGISYGGIEKAVLNPTVSLLIVEGLKLLAVAENGLRTLMIPLIMRVLINTDQADPGMVVQSIDSKIQRETTGKPATTLPRVDVAHLPSTPHKPKAPRSDWLTGVKFRLNHLGYGAGPPIHLYDARCVAAIRRFQRDYGLTIDGVPGAQTQSKLASVCGY